MNTDQEGSRARGKNKPTPEEEAERGTYRLADKQLYIPAINLRSSLIDGGINRMFGPKLYATKLLGSSLFATADHCPLFLPGSTSQIRDYIIDRRRAALPSGAAVSRARPKILIWETSVEFEYDPDFLRPEWITEIFSIAGRIVGVCDYRPKCPKGKGGPFGRYSVALID